MILLNFDALFGFVISFTTRYSQPLLGFMFCIYVGWVWNRDGQLRELKKKVTPILKTRCSGVSGPFT
ncbi:MAG: hypothetical protein R3E54_02955 [Halioglobus sp.]